MQAAESERRRAAAFTRRPAAGTIVLCAAALAALTRAVFVGRTRGDIVFAFPALDGAFYDIWARSLAAGHGDFQGPYFLGPLYPYLISLVYRVFGPDPWHVRLLQSAFGVLDVALVTWIGCRVYGRIAGGAAGVLLAFFGTLVFYEGILVLDVVLTTALLSALAVVVWRGERTSIPWAALAGAIVGIAALARPTALVVLLPIVWAVSKRWRDRRVAIACVLACTVVIAPVVLRNARLGGGLTLTTNGGVNFWAGNNPDARGPFHAPPGVTFFTSPVFEQDTSLPPAVAARALTVRAVAGTDAAAESRRWFAAAFAWMVQHPLDALELWARKAWLVLQAREVAQIESSEFHARRLHMHRLFAVDFGWLWPLAAIGLWHARRRQRDATWTIAAVAVAALLPCIVFFVSARYRLPAVPALALLAGAGVAALIESVRRRRGRELAAALAVGIPLALAAHAGGRPPRSAAGWEHAQMAERWYASGDLAAAIDEQEQAATLLPDHPAAQINLALFWYERGGPGDLERAIERLRQVCRRWPADATAHYNLGLVLESGGDRTGAVAAWRTTLQLDPGFAPARSRLIEAGVPPGP